ncbi:MAG: glycerophosphodiester phosphodiesterase family protein [Clostridia bacterium]|nr:glycerophosphodiester phosphodiesterase family protein [Clostridia bacterium]
METLFERSRKKVMVTAHGGYNAGIITFNSMMGFEAAVKAGADIIEIDVARSAEGKLYVFHPGTEKKMLGYDCDITKMTNAEIEALRNQTSKMPVPTLDELFETFKGRCYINTDKAYSCFPELVESIRRHNIVDQIILKGEVKNTWIYDATEELAPDISFLAVSYETDTALEMCRGRNINYVGSEVVFAKDDAPVTDDAYIEMMHKNGKVLWVNPILFSLTRPLVGGHDDHTSLIDDPAKGWGWLADKGYDILQTDWVTDCITYLRDSGKLYRK